jgi:hypothetical protein
MHHEITAFRSDRRSLGEAAQKFEICGSSARTYQAQRRMFYAIICAAVRTPQMTEDDRRRLQSLDLDDSHVQRMLGGYIASWVRDETGTVVPEEHSVGVLAHFVHGVEMRLDDPRILAALARYLCEWLRNAGFVVSKGAMRAILNDFVRGRRDDFAAVERTAARLQRQALH